MEKYKYIFVVLVYRNVIDIVELLESIRTQVESYKVIIVNNYYDEDTKKKFEKIAIQNECDFLNCENKGYGAGNNAGIRYTVKKYCFEYLIISNPDILIQKFPINILEKYPCGVIGPKIYNLNGKKQNPMLYKNNRFSMRLLYEGIKYNSRAKLFLGKAIHSLQRTFGLIKMERASGKDRKIYQIHGSFLIFTSDSIEKIGAPYDENMFLFGEEGYLAYLLEKKGISTYYCPEIRVLHKEDGSMKFRNDIDNACRQSSLYFYENYYFNSEKY